MEIQKSDHDRFKLQQTGVMTAYVSYPFHIGVGKKTLSPRHTFFNFFFARIYQFGPIGQWGRKVTSCSKLSFFVQKVLTREHETINKTFLNKGTYVMDIGT